MDVKIKYDLNAEDSVLGTMMMNQEAFATCCQQIRASFFYQIECQIIFSALMDIYKTGAYPTYASLKSYLDSRDLTNKIGNKIFDIRSSASIIDFPFYLNIIKSQNFKSTYASIVKKIQSDDYNEQSVDTLCQLVDSARSETNNMQFYTFSESLELFEEGQGFDVWLKNRGQDFLSGKKISGLSTGFPQLDHIIGGLKAGTYNCIAGEPGSGKTGFAAQILSHLVLHGVKCAVLTLEMSLKDIDLRLISINSGVPVSEIESGAVVKNNIKYYDVIHAKKILSQGDNLILCDEHINNLNMLQVMLQKAEDMGCKVVMIDYLQLVTNKSFSTTESIMEISTTIRKMLKKTKMAGLILSQLTKPQGTVGVTSDRLYGSSQIRKDAHTILLLEVDENDNRRLKVDKNREGRSNITLVYQFSGQAFKELTFSGGLKNEQYDEEGDS